MPSDILTTKLGRTSSVRPMIARTAITQPYLERWRSHRMCTVVAPAGYGKSTVLYQLREALRAQQIATAWLSVDADDNDAARLVTYVATALDDAVPSVAARTLAQLKGGAAPSLRPVLATLMADLAERDTPAVLFLDDLHALTEPACLELLERLFSLAPPTLRFVVATRTAPVRGAAELRLRGGVIDFSQAELALTGDELREFFRLQGAAANDDSFIAKLRETTEGWIAGAQLFLLAAPTAEEKLSLLAGFSGKDRGITDYLGAAVLDHQDEATRTFLLATSVLERMSADLCRAVVPETNSQALLERIEDAGLFVIPLDRSRDWYRYHHLFRDFLRGRLELQSPGLAPELLRRASAWCAAHELRREAVAYALAAHDVDGAAALIARYAEETGIVRGDHATIFRWVAALPPERLDQWPFIRLAYAWSLTYTYQLDRAWEQLDKIEFDPSSYRVEVGHIGALAELVEGTRCLITVFRDDMIETRRRISQWFANWPNGPDFAAGGLGSLLAYACIESGEIDRGIDAIEKARAAFVRAQAHHSIAMAHGLHGVLLIRRGGMRAAERAWNEGLKYSRQSWGQYSHAASLLSLQLAEVYYETDQIERAAEFLGLGELALDDIGLVEVACPAYSVKARMLVLRGEIGAALAVLEGGRQRARLLRLPRLYGLLLLEELRILLRIDRIPEAKAVAERLHAEAKALPSEATGTRAAFDDMQSRADALILGTAGGDAHEAARAWTRLIADARQHDQRLRVEALTHKASCLQRLGRLNEAMRTLDEALRIGEQNALMRVFSDDRARLEPILERYVAERDSPLINDYLLAVLACCDVRSTQPERVSAQLRLPSTGAALTATEVKLLRLIEGGLSNREIGSSLFVSEQTVKWHLHNIFIKFGVRNRTAALARARAIGLIR